MRLIDELECEFHEVSRSDFIRGWFGQCISLVCMNGRCIQADLSPCHLWNVCGFVCGLGPV